MHSVKTVIVAAGVALLAAGSASPAEDTFSWTGSYKGMFVCDHVADGKFGTFARPATVKILQTGTEIEMEFDTDVKAGGRPVPVSYRGSVMFSPGGDITTGYVEPCRESFAFKELVRFYPASTVTDGFGVTADSVFYSKALPGLEGKLVIHACKLSITRNSLETPSLQTCDGK